MSKKRTIHQLVHSLSYGDAISNEVLALQRCFRKHGIDSEIFAINVHGRYEGLAQDYKKLGRDFSGDIILHYSIGSPLNDLYRSLSQSTRWLIYHNITPSKWFTKINPRVRSDIEKGIHELPELCKITDRILADSAFNGLEIQQLGFNSEVLGLPVDLGRWHVGPNAGICRNIQAESGIHLLHVGRIAPNKCLEDIVKIFYFLHHHISKKSKLWFIGIDIDTELYSFSLKRLVGELGLQKPVEFIGCRDDSEVRAFYENCTAYLCMSEHEGFCLPVIEAMYFGLPVISYASSALTDTVGDGGIIVTEKRHPEIAELVWQIHSDSKFKAELVKKGKERVQEFSNAAFDAAVVGIFGLEDAEQHGRIPTQATSISA